MAAEEVLYTREDGVGVITLNRPEKLNALTPGIRDGMLRYVREADEDQRQERGAVPFVVGEDVQVVEDLLLHQMRFVEEESRVDPLGAQLSDMMGNFVKDSGGGRLGIEAEGKTELSIEVTPTESGVVAVGEPEAGLGEAMSDGAEDACLAHAGLARKQDVAPLVACVDDGLDDALARRGDPELVVAKLFAEWRTVEVECAEPL